MAEAPRHRFLLRFSGDIGTKRGRARKLFIQRLQGNLADAVSTHGSPYRVIMRRNRILVESPAAEAGETLARVFGLQHLSPIETFPWSTYDDLLEIGEGFFSERVRGKTFCVRAHRGSVRSSLDFDSEKIERDLGSRLLEASAGVDLTRPEVMAAMELEKEVVHLYSDNLLASGGLPIGTQGRALMLISGGLDSAVAAWFVLKRGVQLDYLFYNLGGASHRRQVERVIRHLADNWSYGSRPRLHTLDLRPFVDQMRDRADSSLWQVLLKRAMLRGARDLARRAGAAALVTGDALGQVSSQTLSNLRVVEQAVDLPVLRPLLGFDKNEITDWARRIGTYDLSTKVREYCALEGPRPAVAAKPRAVLAAEAGLSFDSLDEAVRHADTVLLRPQEANAGDKAVSKDAGVVGKDAGAVGKDAGAGGKDAGAGGKDAGAGGKDSEDLAIDRIPPGAVLMDLRSKTAFDAWHYPDALRVDYDQARRAVSHVDGNQVYVVCCEVEFKSAEIAERLRRRGVEAYYFAGGTRQLLRYADRRGLTRLDLVAPAMDR